MCNCGPRYVAVPTILNSVQPATVITQPPGQTPQTPPADQANPTDEQRTIGYVLPPSGGAADLGSTKDDSLQRS